MDDLDRYRYRDRTGRNSAVTCGGDADRVLPTPAVRESYSARAATAVNRDPDALVR